jgi:hypothetical protein
MTADSGAGPSGESYATRSRGESAVPAAAAFSGGDPPAADPHLRATEVWVAGNARPVYGLAIVGVLVAVMAVAVAKAGGGTLVAVTVAGGVPLAIAAAFAAVALRPRLARERGDMVVRLAPLSTQRVPLDVVECVFSGSQPLAEADGGPPRRRVGTLVIRLAERATDWRHRATFAPWGTWDDGHIVIDGRWCEPLSPEFARALAGRLMESKRALRLVRPGDPPTGRCTEAGGSGA